MRTATFLLFASLFPLTISAVCPSDKGSAASWTAQRASELATDEFSESSLRDVTAQLAGCRSSFQNIPGAGVCLDPLARFTRAQLWEFEPQHTLGTALTDGDFLASAPYPAMLRLPARLQESAFLQLLDRNDRPSLDAALGRIADVNAGITDPSLKWQAFEYVSQHLYTPDGTQTLGRFFVYVPGKDFDQYLQFGLQDEPSHAIPNSVSIVAVQKTDPRTHLSLATPEVRLIDLWRLRQSGDYTITTRYAVTGAMENCYGCHKTAVLPITPDPRNFDSARFARTVAFVNREMARYGHVQMAGQDMEGYGPGMGPLESPLRDDAFLANCSQGRLPPARLQRIKHLMRCQSCHDGDTRGLLNFPSAQRASAPYNRSLVEDYIVTHRKMPPGAGDLSTEERGTLLRCLTQEYYEGDRDRPGLLESWLANADCWRR